MSEGKIYCRYHKEVPVQSWMCDCKFDSAISSLKSALLKAEAEKACRHILAEGYPAIRKYSVEMRVVPSAVMGEVQRVPINLPLELTKYKAGDLEKHRLILEKIDNHSSSSPILSVLEECENVLESVRKSYQGKVDWNSIGDRAIQALTRLRELGIGEK